MTLTTITIIIAVAAIVLTGITGFIFNKKENLLISYIQNFLGAWFVFSGFVKAMDPLGTAYKMEQYFAQFEQTFAETWMSFIAPLFPWFSSISIGFSVFMIVLEVVLGLMLIIGAFPKLSSWLLFIIMLFFTALTGFTYLTGYVPMESNFFTFSEWGAFKDAQMRVQDCGCFGDFIKLKPYTSFMKDVVLIIPTILLLIGWKRMHSLFSGGVRTLITGASIVGLLIYCFSNFSWNIPSTDFRPFKEMADVRSIKTAEEEAMSNVEITHYLATNKETGQTVKIPYAQYLKEFRQYPTAEWDLEQLKSKPAIESTKISEFEVTDIDGNDITEEILSEAGWSMMIISKSIESSSRMTTQVQIDSLYKVDTLLSDSGVEMIVNTFDKTVSKEIQKKQFSFDEDYMNIYREVVNPIAEAAEKDGMKVYAVTAPAEAAMLDDFRHATQSAYPYHTADDILLKTIIRSNPGVVIWNDGKIIKKWHWKKLPSAYSEVKTAIGK